MNILLEFLWKYLAGPVMADARNAETAVWKGITAHTGYNPFNTVIWAVLAISIIFLVKRGLESREIKLRTSTALSSIPFILLGGILRFLEDAAVVPFILRPLVITPIIYMVLAGIFLGSLLMASKMESSRDLDRDELLKYIGYLTLLPFVVVTVLVMVQGAEVTPIISSTIIALILTGIYYFMTRRTDYSSKEYLLVAFSQFFGGSVSMISLSHGYTQKQLLTQIFTSIFGQPGVLVLKTAIVGLSVYLIEEDIEEEELKSLALIVLYSIGLGTGLRVMLRTALGI